MPRRGHNATTHAVPSEVSQAMRAASLYGWGLTEDRTERTRKAREAFQNRFLEQAGGDPQRAEALRRSFYTKLALKSAQARRRNREAREGGAAA